MHTATINQHTSTHSCRIPYPYSQPAVYWVSEVSSCTQEIFPFRTSTLHWHAIKSGWFNLGLNFTLLPVSDNTGLPLWSKILSISFLNIFNNLTFNSLCGRKFQRFRTAQRRDATSFYWPTPLTRWSCVQGNHVLTGTLNVKMHHSQEMFISTGGIVLWFCFSGFASLELHLVEELERRWGSIYVAGLVDSKFNGDPTWCCYEEELVNFGQ